MLKEENDIPLFNGICVPVRIVNTRLLVYRDLPHAILVVAAFLDGGGRSDCEGSEQEGGEARGAHCDGLGLAGLSG